MTQYNYRARPVEAFQYQGEHLTDLPDWIRNYNLPTPSPFGNSAVGTSATHNLLIPTATGVINVRNGDWIILENGRLFAIHDKEFHEMFEAASLPAAQNIT